MHIIGIFLPQDSELLQERQLKEDLLQQTEVVSKFQETERKSSVDYSISQYSYTVRDSCGSGKRRRSAFILLMP